MVYLNTGKGTNIYFGEMKHTPQSPPTKNGLQLSLDEEEVYIKLEDNLNTENLLKTVNGAKPTENTNNDYSCFMVGAKIIHYKYGNGTIVERKENNIIVHFSNLSEEKQFNLTYYKGISIIEK